MNDDLQDGLWPYFVPLWTELRTITPKALLAGGYALFLKQRWLVEQSRFTVTSREETLIGDQGEGLAAAIVPTLVDMGRWTDVNPRVTRDFDFIVGLELIASETDQKALHGVLTKHGFEVVPDNARWQFQKKVSADQSVVLDFHAPSPMTPRTDVRVQSRRVKPRRSLGSTGIHGRENPEANAADVHPFNFVYQSVEIAIPHPLAFAIMKLVAMNDRWRVAFDAVKSPEERYTNGRLAKKHAEDLMRIVAMTTRSEMDVTDTVLAVVQGAPPYVAAAGAFDRFFRSNESWGTMQVSRLWAPDDFATMQGVLSTWFY